MTIEQLQARVTELESNNRILLNKINNKEMESQILVKENRDLKQDLEDVQEYVEVTRCCSCKHLVADDLMHEIGNEQVCYTCMNDGYGK